MEPENHHIVNVLILTFQDQVEGGNSIGFRMVDELIRIFFNFLLLFNISKNVFQYLSICLHCIYFSSGNFCKIIISLSKSE
eukprot:UN05616